MFCLEFCRLVGQLVDFCDLDLVVIIEGVDFIVLEILIE